MKKETIIELYNAFVKELPPTEEYRNIRRNLEEQKREFLVNKEKQNEETLEELLDLLELADNELMKQSYIEGFSTATKLIMESISNETRDV